MTPSNQELSPKIEWAFKKKKKKKNQEIIRLHYYLMLLPIQALIIQLCTSYTFPAQWEYGYSNYK